MRLINADELLKDNFISYSRKDIMNATIYECNGHWIVLHPEWKEEYRYVQCSECLHEQKYPTNYCSFCGAKMKNEI